MHINDYHLKNYLTVRVLYPLPDHVDDVLSAVKKVSEEARKHEGLIEIGAWLDKEKNRIVNISLWESEERAIEATKKMHPKFANIPWNEWERQPAENFLGLRRVV